MSSTLSVILELTRIAEPDDPHAFRFEPQGYTLRGPSGGLDRFDIPWSPELLADLTALRQPDRDPTVVQRVGDIMQNALRRVGWTGIGEQIRAASEAGRPVVVTLRSSAAELYALPWELLTVGASGQHLGELPSVLLRHEWPATATCPERPSPRPEGGRVLLAWSAAGGAVPAAAHLRAIAAAWSEGHVGFDPASDVLAHASPARLADALVAAEAAGKPYTVLHLVAHGGLAGSTFGLALDGEDGTATIIDAGRIRQLLAPHAGTLRVVVVAACDGGNTGALGNHLGSVAQALHRAGIQSVVASRYPLSVTGSIVLAETLYHALLVGLHPLERAFTLTRTQLARRAEPLDWASLQLYAREADGDDTRPIVVCPYRGLLAFEGRHRRFFFGRDAERRETLGNLQALIDGDKPRFVVVVGASGTGKSSMVLAGVVPDVAQLKLRREGRWEVLTMTPGATPLTTLHDLLGRRTDERPLLLVVDQFEELVTQTTDPRVRATFVRELWSLSRSDSGLHVIATLRVDFLGHCGDLLVDDTGLSLDRIAYDKAHRVFVARMAREQVRTAIEAPAARVGLTFAPGLLDRLVADVGDEPGALPLLQYALRRLWDRRRGRTLTAEVYEEIGGLVGALERDADALVHDLGENQRQHVRRLLTRLVDTHEDEAVNTRRRVALDQLAPNNMAQRVVFDEVLARLVAARLVVRGEKGGAPTLEVAHEALLRRWQTLRAWIAEDRATLVELDRLKQWTRDWAENKTLLTGTKLDRASEFVRQHPDETDEPVRKLVQASEDERQRLARASEAQRRRRRNIIAAVISVLTVAVLGMIGASLYTFKLRDDTFRQRDRAVAAEKEIRTALTVSDHNLAAALVNRARADDERGALAEKEVLAAHALNLVDSPEARGVLAGARAAARPVRLASVPLPDCFPVAALAIDDVVCAEASNVRRLVAGVEEWRVTTARPTRELRVEADRVWVIAHGLTVTTLSLATGVREDGAWDVLDVNGGETWPVRAGSPGAGLAQSRLVGQCADADVVVVAGLVDGRYAVLCSDGRLGLASGAGPPIFAQALDPAAFVTFTHIHLSPDARLAVVAGIHGRVAVHDLTTRETWTVAPSRPNAVVRIAISPAGDRAAIVRERGGVELFALPELSPLGTIAVTDVRDVRLLTDRSVLIAGARGNTQWALPVSPRPALLTEAQGLSSVQFSPDGRSLVTTHESHALVWDLDTGIKRNVLQAGMGMVKASAFLADGASFVVIAGGTGSPGPRVFDLATGAERWSPPTSLRARWPAVVGGSSVAALEGDVLMWALDAVGVLAVDVDTGEDVKTVDCPALEWRDLASAPAGRRAVLVSVDAGVFIVDPGPVPRCRPVPAPAGASSADVSADGRVVVVGGSRYLARIDTDGHRWTVTHPGVAPHDVALSPDRRWVASAGPDAAARVWDAETGTLRAVLTGHHARVVSIDFSLDGGTLATGSWDGAARLWDLATLDAPAKTLVDEAMATWGLNLADALGG